MSDEVRSDEQVKTTLLAEASKQTLLLNRIADILDDVKSEFANMRAERSGRPPALRVRIDQ